MDSRRNRAFRIITLLSILLSASILLGLNPADIQSRLTAHVRYLASDELEGRKMGTEGNEKAAHYIANYFKDINVRPLGESYFQEFPVITEVRLGENNTVSFEISSPTSDSDSKNQVSKKTTWTIGDQFTPLGYSSSASVSANLVFAGYGITIDTEDQEYDDYASVDASGKIAVVLRGSPEDDNPHSKFIPFEMLRYKATNAREHGASAIVFINADEDSLEELMSLEPDRSYNKSGIVAIHAKRSEIQKLLPADKNLASLVASIKETKEPASFDLKTVKMKITVDLENIEKSTANVIGYVPGTNSDFSNGYIVIGAHFDHLGWGPENSRYEGTEPAIHHGADDNASGTSAMMELARIVAENPLDRPAIFMGFTGEEFGLLGSAYYCKNPSVPLEKTIFMLNLDMVGRMEENKVNVHGTGTSSRWDSLVDSLSKMYTLEVSASSDGWGPSDHTSFYAEKIPVLFLFTGLHDDYHRPSDTWDKLNYAGLEKIVEFSESILRAVADDPEKPDFVETSSPGARRSMAFRVYVGTIPGYADNPKGLRLSGVREDGPAAKAGLQAGDIMIKFGDIDIKTIYDYTYALGKYKPGETIDMVVLRGGNDDRVTCHVTLEKRQ
jgi:aminopeptidase YwaD